MAARKNGRTVVTLIDQRILIDAPPQIIWDYITDPAKIVAWHVGYSGISILTTQRTGAGVRRRCTRECGGPDVIEEITAWVDGLGYEYRVVEGEPARNFQGRIRLQTVPDGTIVQWTVSYEPKGVVGGLRDRMSGRDSQTAAVATSLRQLRRVVDDLGLRMDDSHRARVGIRPRLNAAERAQYQRRHPPAEAAAGAAAEGTPAQQAESRAAAAGDGRQQPSAAEGPGPAPEPARPEPAAAPAPQPDLPLPEHIVPPGPEAAPEPAELARWQPPAARAEAEEPDYRRKTPPRGIPAVSVAPEPAPVEEEERAPSAPATPPTPPAEARPTPAAKAQPIAEPVESERPTPPRGIPAQPAPAKPPAPAKTADDAPKVSPPQTPKTDTGEISIWEVFGLQRPSEQDANALQDLIRSVYEERDEAVPQRLTERVAGVRLRKSGPGLRVRLVMRALRVRLHAVRMNGRAQGK